MSKLGSNKRQRHDLNVACILNPCHICYPAHCALTRAAMYMKPPSKISHLDRYLTTDKIDMTNKKREHNFFVELRDIDANIYNMLLLIVNVKVFKEFV